MGSIFGLLGPNGAGKTTTIKMLIKMLTTMLEPTAGSAKVAGLDIVRQAVEVRRRIGYVSQMLSADGGLTGYENLLLFARLYGIPRAKRRDRIIDALQFMGLGEAERTLVRNYSGGMIRRLEIAQSMLHRPSVLFLDEPTVGLDPVARHAVWQHLRELRTRGCSWKLDAESQNSAFFGIPYQSAFGGRFSSNLGTREAETCAPPRTPHLGTLYRPAKGL